jgi:hypothetical protein
MDEAKKLALREAIELCKSAPGYKSMCVVHVADEIYQWLTKPEARKGEPIWKRPTDIFADGLGVGTTMDWPLVT